MPLCRTRGTRRAECVAACGFAGDSPFTATRRGCHECTLDLAIEIAREGREGRRLGTLFTLGAHKAVLEHSRSLILDPLAGHPEENRAISDPDFRGTVKELAQLDVAFVISETAVFMAACRYLDARALDLKVPHGLGARHMAAAAISKTTPAVGIVVSQTAVLVRKD